MTELQLERLPIISADRQARQKRALMLAARDFLRIVAGALKVLSDALEVYANSV